MLIMGLSGQSCRDAFRTQKKNRDILVTLSRRTFLPLIQHSGLTNSQFLSFMGPMVFVTRALHIVATELDHHPGQPFTGPATIAWRTTN